MVDSISRQLDESQHRLNRARKGDKSSLWRLTQELRPYLKAVVATTLGDELDAKVDPSDVVQQVMTAAVEKFDQFEGETLDQWQAWLVAIARNETRGVARYWRQQRRDVQRERGLVAEGGEPDGVASPSQLAVHREQVADLLKAIESLDQHDQQLIRWRHFQGMSHAAIAERLEITEAATRQRWRAALERLRQKVEARDERSTS